MKNVLLPEHKAALEQVRLAVESKEVTQTLISSETGVDQSQISRILSGDAKRLSKNVLKLCSYANSLGTQRTNDPVQSQPLMHALSTVWDGTPAHAEAIAAVILSLRNFGR